MLTEEERVFELGVRVLPRDHRPAAARLSCVVRTPGELQEVLSGSSAVLHQPTRPSRDPGG